MNRFRTFPLGALFLFLSTGLSQISSLAIVEENGPRAKRLNLVFLSEGYTAADLPNFATHVNTARDFLFTREPWQQYRSYCNVYRIEIASNQSGTDNGDAGGTRDTYFNSGFNTPSIPQLLTFDGTGQSRAYSRLNAHVPEYDVPVLLVNDTKYGGAGGGISTASVHSFSAQIIEHEIGHSFAGLADEYDVEYPEYTPYESPNATQQTTRALIKWNHWINTSTPVPTPETSAYNNLAGLFEGAVYRTTGWYRPHNNSLMRNLGRPCGQVNREQFVLNYYSRISPLDDWAPAALTGSISTFQDLTFTVTPKAPSSGVALLVTWKVDGVTQAGATGASFSISSDALGNGSHTVAGTVHDPTALVRLDPSGLLDDAVTWTRTLSNQLPATLTAWRTAYGADTANPANDGFVNLVKYALGVDPAKTIAPTQAPAGSISPPGPDGFFTLTIPRRTRRTDVTSTVEISSDLAIWNSGPGHTVIVEDLDDLLVVRDALPVSSSSRRAMRLKVVPN